MKEDFREALEEAFSKEKLEEAERAVFAKEELNDDQPDSVAGGKPKMSGLDKFMSKIGIALGEWLEDGFGIQI